MTLIERDHVPSEASLPTPYGEFVIRVFHEEETGLDHVAMTLGSMDGPDPVLVRLHSECLTGDVFGSLRCDCGPQLHAALERISTRGWGVVLYLRAGRVGASDCTGRSKRIGCRITASTRSMRTSL